jgi:hypothetical protein
MSFVCNDFQVCTTIKLIAVPKYLPKTIYIVLRIAYSTPINKYAYQDWTGLFELLVGLMVKNRVGLKLYLACTTIMDVII